LGIENILPKSLKGKISKASEYQECLDFFTDFKNEFSQYSINDFYDLDHFFWKYSSKKFKSSKLTMPEFYFVKKDFDSTTGKKADAQYLHGRFKELLDVLDDRFDQSYARKPASYSFHPFNRGYQKWVNHAWIGVPLAPTEKNPRQATQFQVALTKRDDLHFMLNIDDKARDTKKKVAKNIQKNIQKFLNLLRNLPNEYYIDIIASEKSGWKSFEPKKITEQDIEYIIKSLPLRYSEFAITKYFTKAEAIKQKTKILDDILESSRILLPVIQFLEGKQYVGPGVSSTQYDRLKKILEYKKQVIFYGPPGTGKTREAILFAKQFASDSNKIFNVTFHQSYSYDEFVEGIKADVKDEKLLYSIQDGIFKKICVQARKEDNKNFVLIIDEINRGNISKIFGELISLIENNKRNRDDFAISLAYSKKEFTVPKNVFIVGTMNTADRSLVQIDLALRRRFGFVEFMPRTDVLGDAEGVSLPLLLTKLNRKILDNGGDREHQIGHSYFMKDESSLSTLDELKFAFETDVIPLLQEYFYQDYNVLKNVLGETFVDAHEKVIKPLSQAEFRKGIEEILSYGSSD